jgi:hypothetical protein
MTTTPGRRTAHRRTQRTAVRHAAGNACPATKENPPVMTPGQMASELIGGLDGPHADKHTSATAHLAAETIRYLNYATGPHACTGVTEPATVYAVLGGLATAVARLPQIFGQLTGWLDREQATGHLADDCGGPVAVLIDRTRHDLDRAARYAGELAGMLSAAQSATGRLHTNRR